MGQKRKKIIRTDEGVCLRRLHYGNTSQVTSFITPDTGRVDCMLKGAWRAPAKGVSSGVDLGGRYRLVYKQSVSGSLDTLLQCSLIEQIEGIRHSVERALCAYYALELMLNFITYEQDCRQVYDSLLSAMRRFGSGRNLGLSVLELEVNVLKHDGSCPDFSSCGGCGCEWNRGSVFFSSAQGLFLCKLCSRKAEDAGFGVSLSVRPEAVKLLNNLVFKNDSVYKPYPPQIVVAASKVLRHHISWLLGKQLYLWDYLHNRHYSRSIDTARSPQNSKVKRS